MNNKVELIGSYGSDEIIACSAWTSTSRKLTKKKRERVPAMLNSLWEAGHETPFEKATVHFLVDTDIASHIHLLKHRMSSMNGESARYKELKEDKYYIPTDWLADNEGGKIGQSLNKWTARLQELTKETNSLYHECLKELEPILGRSRAKESARFFKMYNSQIEGDVSFNMRSFANFLKLRKSKHAQLEIREIAQEMYDLVKALPQFKHTMEAFDKHTLTEKKYCKC